MLTLQRKIIFCVLFAAVWVQSTKALTEEEEKDINHLRDSLIHAKGKQYKSERGIDHLKSWKSWDGIKDHIKLKIASKYKQKLNEERLNFESGEDKLAKLALEALDDYIKEWLEDMELQHNPEMVYQLTVLVEQGQFLGFIAKEQ